MNDSRLCNIKLLIRALQQDVGCSIVITLSGRPSIIRSQGPYVAILGPLSFVCKKLATFIFLFYRYLGNKKSILPFLYSRLTLFSKTLNFDLKITLFVNLKLGVGLSYICFELLIKIILTKQTIRIMIFQYISLFIT